ncbi:MAG: glycosyltransferase [Cyclobacteriaceae bacterium]|jgi:cellulose synthase/poly-beta-1,6-N-acetylglucosamine synthase-like glycosyltransferase|nr:glycosyltransferase [Cyclobacteriaceae bacterium]
MVLALIFVASLYFLFLLLLRQGWKKALRTHSIPPPACQPSVSVVIAARNEAANLGAVLAALERQTLRGFEVVVVDDHSHDDTAAIARAFSGNPTYAINVVRLSARSGKKAAITTGVHRARGSVILTTDADCNVGPRWIESMVASFGPQVKFVSGGVRIGPAESFSAQLQAAEFASLVGAGASAIGLGYPVMCNGANMAFTRDTFLEVGGYSGNDHIPSGDDVFLLQKVHAWYPGSTVFCPHADAVVETAAVSWRHFVNQRIRWGAKWRHATSLTTPALALFIGCFHLGWLLLLPAAIFSGAVVASVVLFLAKALLEMLYLREVHRFLGVKWSWPIFLLLQLTYSAYVVIVGVLANFKAPSWKGRKIRRALVEMDSRIGG